MKALGYARVSSEKQADFGVSLDAQQEKIRAMAVVHSATLMEIIRGFCDRMCPWERDGPDPKHG
jgi:DNA invertase Pin-like site-specific DNA recombinase